MSEEDPPALMSSSEDKSVSRSDLESESESESESTSGSESEPDGSKDSGVTEKKVEAGVTEKKVEAGVTEKKVEAGVTRNNVEAPMKLVVTEKQVVNRYVEKRSPEITNEGVHVKRVKVSEKKEKKKPNFQRVRSEDDEVALLKGLIDYKTDTELVWGEALESAGKSKRVDSLKHEDAERESSSLV